MNLVTEAKSWDKLRNGQIFEAISDKKEVLEYLENNQNIGYSSEYVVDTVTAEKTKIPNISFQENGYFWTSNINYHFEKYNLPLKPEFLDYIRNQLSKLMLTQ